MRPTEGFTAECMNVYFIASRLNGLLIRHKIQYDTEHRVSVYDRRDYMVRLNIFKTNV